MSPKLLSPRLRVKLEVSDAPGPAVSSPSSAPSRLKFDVVLIGLKVERKLDSGSDRFPVMPPALSKILKPPNGMTMFATLVGMLLISFITPMMFRIRLMSN